MVAQLLEGSKPTKKELEEISNLISRHRHKEQ